MDTLTIAVTIGQLIMSGVLIGLCEYWRRRARASERTDLQTALEMYHARQDGIDEGLTAGRKHGIGLMYKIAVKAHHEGRDVLEALRAVGREQLDIPIVQVPDLVSHETTDL